MIDLVWSDHVISSQYGGYYAHCFECFCCKGSLRVPLETILEDLAIFDCNSGVHYYTYTISTNSDCVVWIC